MIQRLRAACCLALIASATVLGQTDPKNALLERAGWDALAAGRPRAAADAFQEALARDPNNARLLLGAGTAAYLDRRDADARLALERALQLDRTLTRARVLLGRVLYRIGDLTGAIRTYDALVAAAPKGVTDEEIVATLDRWRREAELKNRMQLAVGSHFTVSFEGPAEERLAVEALESAERAYWRIGGSLSTYPVDPIALVLYSNEQFRDITRSPAWAAGAYDGTIRIPMRGALDDARELDRVVAHEFAHALVHTLAPRSVPTWLNEGLATALERDNLSWAELHLRQAGKPLSQGVLQGSFSRLTGREAQLAYATSALIVGRLIDEAGGFAVANLLRDIGEGKDFQTAFGHRMPRSFDDFVTSLGVP